MHRNKERVVMFTFTSFSDSFVQVILEDLHVSTVSFAPPDMHGCTTMSQNSE